MSVQFSRTTRALAGETSRLALIAWAVVATLMSVWVAWFVLGRVTVYEISRTARLEVQQAPHALASLVSGRVVSSGLALDKEVQAGDVLLVLDSATELLRLREEEARLSAMPARIRSLQSEIALTEQARGEEAHASVAAVESARHRTREATAAASFARDNERRLREEAEVGGVARMEAMRALSEFQKLTATRDALASEARKLEFDVQTRAREQSAHIEKLRGDLVSLRGEEDTARATVERLKAEIDKHSIRAPVSGRIGEAAVLRAGAYVGEGQKLATIVPHGDLMILADFDPATALGRVRPGQRARMRLDGFPWAQYGTVVARVSRVASELRDGKVRVEFNVDASSVQRTWLQHGLPGSIEVSVDEASPAVLVLRAAGQMLSQDTAPAAPADRQPRS